MFSFSSSYIGGHADLVAHKFTIDMPQFLIVYGLVAVSLLGATLLAWMAEKDGVKNVG